MHVYTLEVGCSSRSRKLFWSASTIKPWNKPYIQVCEGSESCEGYSNGRVLFVSLCPRHMWLENVKAISSLMGGRTDAPWQKIKGVHRDAETLDMMRWNSLPCTTTDGKSHRSLSLSLSLVIVSPPFLIYLIFFLTCWGWSVDMFGFEQETTPRRLFKSASEKRQTSVTSCQPIRPFQPLRRPFLQQLPHPLAVRTSERQSRRRRFFSFQSAYWHWSIVIILSIQGDFLLFCFDFTERKQQQKQHHNTQKPQKNMF